jgi:hypothetical protein
MDHRGPEHHYDELENQDSSATFFQQGEIQPETVETKDGERPFRGTPNGVRSEMTERSTPLDGDSEDRGGNPLRTDKGILAKSIIEEAEEKEEADQVTSPTDPAGLGELHPVKDNQWKPGDKSDRSMGRDEMLGSVRKAAESLSDDNEDWDEVVKDFENAIPEPATAAGKRQKEINDLEKIPVADWLEGTEHNSSSDFPIEHLGWDIVDVVEPSKELTEASNKYSMPLPRGITDNLHEALIKLNAWVENPEENGKLRPYKEYWSVIRPKASQDLIQIGVEDPHMADIINDVARTDSLSGLERSSAVEKESFIPGLMALLGGAGLRALLPAAGRLLGGAAAKGIGQTLLKGGLLGAGAQAGANALKGGENTLQTAMPQGVATAKIATYGDEYEHPTSVPRRVEDLENIDPHQRSDESNDDWAYDMLDVNADGSTNDPRGKDDQKEKIRRLFAANEEEELSDALNLFIEKLPKIMEFFNSEESGADDPDIQEVHKALELEHPGYLDMPDTPESEEIFIVLNDALSNNHKSSSEEATGPTCFKCGRPVDGPGPLCEEHASEQEESITAKQGPDASSHSVQKATDQWLSPVDPALAVGNQLNNTFKQLGITSSNTQGPHTDEQQNQFIEHLHEKLDSGELNESAVKTLESIMFEEPSNPEVVKIWSEVTKDQPVFDSDPQDMQQDAQANPVAPPGVPPGGMPPAPNQGMAPGMPPMGTPEPMNAPPPGAPQMLASVHSSMLESAFKHGADNIAGKCPKCKSHTTKMLQQDGVSKCHTCGHQWEDKTFQKADGDSSNSSTTAAYHRALEEIEESQHLDSFNEPEEEIKIDDSSHEWADEDGEPLQEGQEYEIYANDYEIPDVGRLNEIKPDSLVYTIESNGGLNTTIEIDRKEADLNGYRFVSTKGGTENNPHGIEENMDSKPVPVPGESTDLSTPHVMTGSIKESISHFYACPADPNCKFNAEGGSFEPGVCPYHNVETVPADKDYMDKIGSELHRTAGKHYTPMEQRELIDEYGEARNADKLNLENTHYAEVNDDYFLFGC